MRAGEVSYASLQRILLDQVQKQLLQIHLNNKKDSNMPPKMNLITDARQMLVHFLKFAWKTDYTVRNLEVRELPIYRSRINIEVPQGNGGGLTPQFLLKPQEPYGALELDGYHFVL